MEELGFYDLVLATQVYKTEQQYNMCSVYNQVYFLFSAKIIRTDLVSLSIAYHLYLKISLLVQGLVLASTTEKQNLMFSFISNNFSFIFKGPLTRPGSGRMS